MADRLVVWHIQVCSEVVDSCTAVFVVLSLVLVLIVAVTEVLFISVHLTSRLSSSIADDGSNMLIRNHELGLLKHLLNRAVAAHTAVDIWFAINNDALEEHQCSSCSANDLPYHAVGGWIFGAVISVKKKTNSGIHV